MVSHGTACPLHLVPSPWSYGIHPRWAEIIKRSIQSRPKIQTFEGPLERQVSFEFPENLIHLEESGSNYEGLPRLKYPLPKDLPGWIFSKCFHWLLQNWLCLLEARVFKVCHSLFQKNLCYCYCSLRNTYFDHLPDSYKSNAWNLSCKNQAWFLLLQNPERDFITS